MFIVHNYMVLVSKACSKNSYGLDFLSYWEYFYENFGNNYTFLINISEYYNLKVNMFMYFISHQIIFIFIFSGL